MVSSRKTHSKGRKKMQPSAWQPPVELSEQEEQIVKRIRKAKLFVFLRQHRHELLDEAFRAANWRVCIGTRSVDSLRLLRGCSPWRLFCKPIWASQMMR